MAVNDMDGKPNLHDEALAAQTLLRAMRSSDEHDEADEEIDKLLVAVAEARRTGIWPGRYEEKVETLRRPAWTQARLEDVEVLETDPADAGPLEMEG